MHVSHSLRSVLLSLSQQVRTCQGCGCHSKHVEYLWRNRLYTGHKAHTSSIICAINFRHCQMSRYGRMMRHQPAEKNKRGEHDPDNYQKMKSWPDYASGAGYAVTRDVARLLAYPPIPLRFQKNEDRRIGMVLLGFNVSFVDAVRFKPWGHCEPDTILMHYHRRRDLMLRRYARVMAGQSICGPGWEVGEMCVRVPHDGNVTVVCPGTTTVQNVLFASFGQVRGLDVAGKACLTHADDSISLLQISATDEPPPHWLLFSI
jgi:hypothetical protein